MFSPIFSQLFKNYKGYVIGNDYQQAFCYLQMTNYLIEYIDGMQDGIQENVQK